MSGGCSVNGVAGSAAPRRRLVVRGTHVLSLPHPQHLRGGCGKGGSHLRSVDTSEKKPQPVKLCGHQLVRQRLESFPSLSADFLPQVRNGFTISGDRWKFQKNCPLSLYVTSRGFSFLHSSFLPGGFFARSWPRPPEASEFSQERRSRHLLPTDVYAPVAGLGWPVAPQLVRPAGQRVSILNSECDCDSKSWATNGVGGGVSVLFL